METKIDAGNIFAAWHKWEVLEEHARALNVSGNMLHRFGDVYRNLYWLSRDKILTCCFLSCFRASFSTYIT